MRIYYETKTCHKVDERRWIQRQEEIVNNEFTPLDEMDEMKTEENEMMENSEMVVCVGCGDEVLKSDAVLAYGDYWCHDCYKDEFVTCDECGQIVHCNSASWVEYNERVVCDDCLETLYTRCDECGELVPNDEIHDVDGNEVCENCIDSSYKIRYCEECGSPHYEHNMHEDNDGYFFCDDCYVDDCIDSYHEPRRHFKFISPGSTSSSPKKANIRSKNPYLGYELEVPFMLRGAKSSTVLYEEYDMLLENDSSVEDGYEIISDSRTLNAWKQYDLEGMFGHIRDNCIDYSVPEDYRFQNNNCAGVHIHISNPVNWKTDETDWHAIRKIIDFVIENFNDCIKFGRRDPEDVYYFKPIVPRYFTIDHAIAVNLQSVYEGHIEFRFFNSTTDASHMRAILEFSEGLRNYSEQKVDTITWENLTNYMRKFGDRYANFLNEYENNFESEYIQEQGYDYNRDIPKYKNKEDLNNIFDINA